MFVATLEAREQLLDRTRLIAGRLELGIQAQLHKLRKLKQQTKLNHLLEDCLSLWKIIHSYDQSKWYKISW